MASELERKAWVAVWFVDRLGFCALAVVLLFVLLSRLSVAQESIDDLQGGQHHFDLILAPQTVLLRAMCRGMAREQAWPIEIARECDVAVPAPMPVRPERRDPGWLLGWLTDERESAAP